MPRQFSRSHKKGRTTPLVILFGLMGLLALPAGAGLFGPAARAESASDVNASAAAAIGCSSADFTAPRTFDLSGSQNSRGVPTDIALGDFNGDGRADMAVSHSGQTGGSPTVSILLDDGAGGYTAATPISYFPGSALYRVVAADFNKDGKADVAAVGTLSQPFSHIVSVSLSNGDGTFGAPNNLTSSSSQIPYDLAVGEFNADGNLDLVVINGGSQNYSILFGNGAGGFSFTAVQSVGTRFDRVAVADFNGDTKQDFVITDFDDRRVVIMRNNDNGVFGVAQAVTLTHVPDAVVAGDFNGDGKADIAVANQPVLSNGLATDDGSVAVLLNDGAGNFAAPVYYKVGSTPREIVAADFDGDNKLDLAVADRTSFNTQASTVYVLSGDGAGAFSNAAAFDFPGAHTAIAAQDLDSDGRIDIAGIIGTGIVGVLYGKAPVALPCLLLDDVAVTEGDAGSSNAAVTVRLSQASAQEVRVNYQLTGFTATEGQDFTGGSGTLIFAPGETAKDVNVSITGDVLDELDESITLQLSNPVNARLSDSIAKLVITDNEQQPTISINDVSVAEGDNQFSSNQAVFTVSLSAPSGLVVHVDYSVTAGTATLNSDFSNSQGTVFFEPGITSKTISVSLGGDRTYEPNETFFVNLTNPGDATIADGQGLGTILNDDPLPAITILNAAGSETTIPSGGTASMSVRLSNPSSLPVTVNYATADGNATAGSDYVAASGTLTFAPGETEKNITLTILDDTVDEVYEEFFVNLTNPTNATIEDGQASCQIIDNDGPAVSINDVSVVEGQGGRTLATFTLSLSAPSPQTVAVTARTANGTAVSNAFPADYQTAFRPVIFNPGTTTTTFTVIVNGDLVIEPDETFFVNLSQPTDCTIADAQGVGTITNDDVTSVQFSAAEMSVGEADGSVQVTVMRVGDTSGSITVVYGTFDSSASERSDYTASFGTLRFGPGETSKTITVFITNDALLENPESFFIALGGPDGGATNQPSTISVTINSDDATNGPNPVNDSTFFVRQHYRDFLSRDPDPSGLAFWTNEIEQCGSNAQCREVKRINVSAAFFLSIEFQNTGYLVERMYKAAYGDTTGTTRITGSNVSIPVPVIRRSDFLTDAAALREGVVVNVGDWEQRLEANKTSFALVFVQRQRFRDANPLSLTPAAFVAKLNLNTGGALTQAEVDALAAEFGGAADTSDEARRASVFRKVAENAEFDRREKNRAFVLMQFFGYLQRDPNALPDIDHTGWKFWLDKLNQFNGDYIGAEMVKAFIQSDEYVKRFGQ